VSRCKISNKTETETKAISIPNQEDPDNKKYKKERKNKKTPSLFNQIGIGGL
jgi:hypothetical protein